MCSDCAGGVSCGDEGERDELRAHLVDDGTLARGAAAMAREDDVNEPLPERQLHFQQQMQRIYAQQRIATRLFVGALVVMCAGLIWLGASVALLLTGH